MSKFEYGELDIFRGEQLLLEAVLQEATIVSLQSAKTPSTLAPTTGAPRSMMIHSIIYLLKNCILNLLLFLWLCWQSSSTIASSYKLVTTDLHIKEIPSSDSRGAHLICTVRLNLIDAAKGYD